MQPCKAIHKHIESSNLAQECHSSLESRPSKQVESGHFEPGRRGRSDLSLQTTQNPRTRHRCQTFAPRLQ